MILKLFVIISCIFNHTRYTNTRRMGSHIELPSGNDRNLYLLSKFFDGTLAKMSMDGFDTRYNDIVTPSIEELSFSLLRNYLLQLLNDNDTSIYTKIQLIREFEFLFEFDTLDPRIITNDLLDDWNNEI